MKNFAKLPIKSVSLSNHIKDHCSSCDGQVKSSRREFSVQAWSALVAWNEIPEAAVDGHFCNDCYYNVRDVLIERADDLRTLPISSHFAQAQVMAVGNYAR